LITRIYRELKKRNSKRINDPRKIGTNEPNRKFQRSTNDQCIHKEMFTIPGHKEVQIKALGFHLTPVGKATIKNTTNAGGGRSRYGMEAPHKSKSRTTIRSGDGTSGLYLKECTSEYNKDTCTPMFIAAPFTIARPWSSPDVLQLMSGLRKCDVCT
jgi:hypothetical protein